MVRYLLDTQLLIWALTESKELPKEARLILTSRSSAIYVSIASVWELAIKTATGKLKLPVKDMEAEILGIGAILIGIEFEHCRRTETLPDIHRDPFDRMLVAQSDVEHMDLLTTDPVLAQYGPHVRVF